MHTPIHTPADDPEPQQQQRPACTLRQTCRDVDALFDALSQSRRLPAAPRLTHSPMQAPPEPSTSTTRAIYLFSHAYARTIYSRALARAHAHAHNARARTHTRTHPHTRSSWMQRRTAAALCARRVGRWCAVIAGRHTSTLGAPLCMPHVTRKWTWR